MDNESIQTACAKPKGRPPTMRFMQQAATCWLLPLPNLPDGGLITGAACNPKPWVSPAAVDTMRDAKLFSILDCRTCVCLLHLSFSFSDPFQKFASLLAPLFCHAAVYCYQTLAISGEENAAITQLKIGRKNVWISFIPRDWEADLLCCQLLDIL